MIWILSAIAAIGWFEAIKTKVAMATVGVYMKEKGYTPPTSEEVRKCLPIAVKKMLHKF